MHNGEPMPSNVVPAPGTGTSGAADAGAAAPAEAVTPSSAVSPYCGG